VGRFIVQVKYVGKNANAPQEEIRRRIRQRALGWKQNIRLRDGEREALAHRWT